MKKIFNFFWKGINKKELSCEKFHSLYEVEKNFDKLKEECFWFVIPWEDIKGLLFDIKEKTISFQKDYKPYNFITLKFMDNCLFHKLRKIENLQKIKFFVKATSEDIGKIILLVLEIKV